MRNVVLDGPVIRQIGAEDRSCQAIGSHSPQKVMSRIEEIHRIHGCFLRAVCHDGVGIRACIQGVALEHQYPVAPRRSRVQVLEDERKASCQINELNIYHLFILYS
jgi:hypothetical protein